MRDVLVLAGLLAAAVGVFYLVGSALKKREQRWQSDDWRRDAPTSRVGNALLEVQSLLEPGVRATLQERQRARKQEEGEADPPTAGGAAES